MAENHSSLHQGDYVERERERERNSRCFEDRPNSIHRFQWNCIVSFSFWCKEAEIEELELVDMLGSL